MLSPADAGYEAKLITATIPRTADAPSLGLVLDEIIGDDEKGIVAIESLVEGGNGERSDVAIEPGDALVAVAAAGDPNSGVSLEGLPYDVPTQRLKPWNTALLHHVLHSAHLSRIRALV